MHVSTSGRQLPSGIVSAPIPPTLTHDSHSGPLTRRDGCGIELRLALDTLNLLQEGPIRVVPCARQF